MAVPTSGESCCSWRGVWDELSFEPVLDFVSIFGTDLVDCWCFGGSPAIADIDGPAKIDANEAMTMRRVELLIVLPSSLARLSPARTLPLILNVVPKLTAKKRSLGEIVSQRVSSVTACSPRAAPIAPRPGVLR